jgi:hypothetical protein
MPRADRVHSTPPTNTSAPTLNLRDAASWSRRRAWPLPAPPLAPACLARATSRGPESSNAEADPIFAAIEAHRSAIAAHGDAISAESALEQSLPDDRQRSDITARGKKRSSKAMIPVGWPRYGHAGRHRTSWMIVRSIWSISILRP